MAVDPRLIDLCARYLRTPTGSFMDPVLGQVLTWNPPLADDEAQIYADLQVMSRLGLNWLSPADYAAARPDANLCLSLLGATLADPDPALLVAFVTDPTPTQAEAIAAVKALARVAAADRAALQALIRLVRLTVLRR